MIKLQNNQHRILYHILDHHHYHLNNLNDKRKELKSLTNIITILLHLLFSTQIVLIKWEKVE